MVAFYPFVGKKNLVQFDGEKCVSACLFETYLLEHEV